MRSTGRLLELVFSLSSFISLDDPRKTLVSPTDSDRIYWLIQSKCIPNFFSATRFYRYPTLRHVLDSQVDDHIFLASWMLTWAILPGLLVILVQHLLLSHLRILRLCFHRLVSVLGPKRATRRLHLPCLLPVVQFNKISIVPKTKCYRIRKINLMIVTLLLYWFPCWLRWKAYPGRAVTSRMQRSAVSGWNTELLSKEQLCIQPCKYLAPFKSFYLTFPGSTTAPHM